MRMRCGFFFGSKELNIHSHSDFEDLTVRSAVAAAFFLSLYSTAHRVNAAVWLYGRMLW